MLLVIKCMNDKTEKLKHLPIDPGIPVFLIQKMKSFILVRLKIFEIGLDHVLESKRNVPENITMIKHIDNLDWIVVRVK